MNNHFFLLWFLQLIILIGLKTFSQLTCNFLFFNFMTSIWCIWQVPNHSLLLYYSRKMERRYLKEKQVMSSNIFSPSEWVSRSSEITEDYPLPINNVKHQSVMMLMNLLAVCPLLHTPAMILGLTCQHWKVECKKMCKLVDNYRDTESIFNNTHTFSCWPYRSNGTPLFHQKSN